MRSQSAISMLVLPAVIVGCASAPQQRDIVNSFPVPSATTEEVFTATVQSLAALNLPASSTDRNSGTIATEWTGLTEAAQYADCGSAGVANSFRNYETRINVLITNTGPQPEIRINTTFRADRFEGGLTQRVLDQRTCLSTGVLEAEINAAIQQRLTGG